MTSSIQLKDGIANTVANDQPQGMIIKIVGAVAVAHLLNDLIQAVLPAIYPMLKANFSLSFAEAWPNLVCISNYRFTATALDWTLYR